MIKFSLMFPGVLYAHCNRIVVIEKSNQVSAVIYILNNLVPWHPRGLPYYAAKGWSTFSRPSTQKLDPSRRTKNVEKGKEAAWF